MKRKNQYAPERSRSDGATLPLAFAYDDTAYYFDIDGYDDSLTTIAVKGDDVTEGKRANEMLVNAIHEYGKRRGKVFIARFFSDCVVNELEESQEPTAC